MKVNRDIVELLEREVDVKRLVDKLFFNIDNLEIAALKQPKLYLEAGRLRAQAALEVGTLKRKLGKIYGEESIKIRHKRTGLTETAIKSKISMNHEVQSAQKQLDNAEVYEEFAKQLTEAYKERLMVIAVLSRLRASEVSSELRAVKNNETVQGMRKRAHQARKHFEELGNDDEF